MVISSPHCSLSSPFVFPRPIHRVLCFFFFNDTATTEIYTLSLHDALPISSGPRPPGAVSGSALCPQYRGDRKSTRLNSSHEWISYAVFCLKKKKMCVICCVRCGRRLGASALVAWVRGS